MHDLIDRQAAIDAMYKILHDYFWANDEELDAIIATLNDLPSAQPEPRWIPCSKKLPDTCGYYLTSTENDEVYCDYWDTEKFDQWFDEGHFDRLERIVAWMPLPEPYKSESEG